MRDSRARYAIQRRAKLLTLLAASVVTSDRALAACDPTSPVNNATVTCTGTTVNQNGIAGYGSAGDNNNTYNIQPGATVEGTSFGVRFDTGATFNNSGTIIGTNASGIIATGNAGNDVTVNNAGTGVISGHIGINVVALALNNAGQVLGTGTVEGAINTGLAATVTNQSTGIIAGVGFGINAHTRATVDNSGGISAGASGVAVSAGAVDLINRATGTISGGSGIRATDTVSVTNAGTISGAGTDGSGVSAGNATVSNSGNISGGEVGIFATVASVTNSGAISGGLNGIEGALVSVNNAGTISGGTTGSGVAATATATSTATVNNMTGGTITGGSFGIVASVAHIDNAGQITATNATGLGIRVEQGTSEVANRATGIVSGGIGISGGPGAMVNIANAGTISGIFAGIQSIGNINVTSNTGVISGGEGGVGGGQAVTVNNSGIISGRIAIEGGTVATVNNAGPGTISGRDLGILAGVANVVNSGTISGGIGIQAFNVSTGSTIDNSGAIIGTGGTAIQLTSAADTLTLRAGSRITGVVDMGFGNDVVNVALSAPSRVSSLTTINLPTFINFTGIINTSVVAGNNVNPSVVVGTTLATLDPTALAQADRALMDFTGGVSSLVQGRLNGMSPTSNGSMMAMAYAPESDKAGPFTKAPSLMNPAPITVWANSFGGQRTQDETAATLRTTNTAWSAAIGIDRKLRPDWLVGAFVGGGSGRLSVDLNSQHVDTDYVFGGAYSRFEWAAQFLDFTLQGGSASNKSNRLVLNNGATETANARYNGWFISPELAYGIRYGIGNGYVLMPTARLRYVAGFFDGYAESGSAQNLTVGSRTLQNFEERGELEVSKTTDFFGGDHTLKTNVHGGVIALQRVGNTTVDSVLIGQNLSFAAPGKGSTVGAVFGAGFDYHTSKNVALFGAVEGIAMSDQSRTATARGGVRVAF